MDRKKEIWLESLRLNDGEFGCVDTGSSANVRNEHQVFEQTQSNFEVVTRVVRQRKGNLPKFVSLELYALFKQAKQGNVTGRRPPMISFTHRAKYDAWRAKWNMERLDAMQTYIGLAEEWVLNPCSERIS